MATIRAYTTIEQSRKLAEILPLESADMLFQLGEDKYADSIRVPLTKKHWEQMMPDINPCWSLASLLGVLPKNLNIGRPSLVSNYKGCYWIQYYDEFMKPNNYKTECFNNPVDACYELILKLNELKML